MKFIFTCQTKHSHVQPNPWHKTIKLLKCQMDWIWVWFFSERLTTSKINISVLIFHSGFILKYSWSSSFLRRLQCYLWVGPGLVFVCGRMAFDKGIADDRHKHHKQKVGGVHKVEVDDWPVLLQKQVQCWITWYQLLHFLPESYHCSYLPHKPNGAYPYVVLLLHNVSELCFCKLKHLHICWTQLNPD